LDDALTELEICDDDELVRMKYGDCFFHVKVSHSKEIIEKHTSLAKKEANEIAEVKFETD
jgi:chaperonin cofactor prefoldin